MSQVATNIIKDIKNKILSPIYFLQGDEPYFIDRISKTIEDHVLTEDEKGFNQSVIYGNDVEISQIVALAKQFPMSGERQVIIVKEAQHLSRNIDGLEAYAENPQSSTILVLNYKGKKLDGRMKLGKLIKKNGVLFDSPVVYDNQIPAFIDGICKESGLTIDTKSKYMLTEFLGTDLGRIYNELQKLKIIVKDGNISPEIIERNIGISKDYNNFELQNAIETRNAEKAFRISKYFGQNPNQNPLVVTLAVLFRLFSNLIIYHTLSDKTAQNVAKELGVSPYFVKTYQQAASHYPLKKTTRIISLLRDADVKSKGVGATGNITQKEILDELIFKIMMN
ncbi:MAG: DNA polymerase III subunit delta [Weeksellaceae bacterium]